MNSLSTILVKGGTLAAIGAACGGAHCATPAYYWNCEHAYVSPIERIGSASVEVRQLAPTKVASPELIAAASAIALASLDKPVPVDVQRIIARDWFDYLD